MADLKFSKGDIDNAMKRNGLDILTIVPKKCMTDAITHLRSTFEKPDTKAKWNQFWNYFQKTWYNVLGTERFKLKTWNIYDIVQKGVEIGNRTNNALERYNRHLNTLFTAKPSIYHLNDTLKLESTRVKEKLDRIRNGNEKANDYLEPWLPEFTDEWKEILKID